MKYKIIIIGIIAIILLSYSVSAATNWHSESFGGSVTVEEPLVNNSVSFSNPNPSNGSINVDVMQTMWNITIQDPEGDTFNWTIEISNGDSNSSNDDTNGSKFVELTTPLDYSTNYTVWVNATDSGSGTWINETFWFITNVSVNWYSASFGGSVTVYSEDPYIYDESPENASTGQPITGLLLSINVTEYQSQKFNITWSTNATSWTTYNSSCDSGTYSQYITWANTSDTTYWWTVQVNDTEGNWNNQTYHFTCAGYVWGNWSAYWKIGSTSVYDVDLNMTVNMTDVVSVVSYYLNTGDPGWIVQDINDDGIINYIDISGIAAHYNEDYT